MSKQRLIGLGIAVAVLATGSIANADMIPLAITGAVLTLSLTGGTINVYSQVGLVMLVGLITKHGILIVSFANDLQLQGRSIREAVIEAAGLRLRR